MSGEHSRTKSEIVLCYKCRGSGRIEHEELVCYHKRDYDYWHTTCKDCEGHGRIKETIETIVTREPYATPPITEKDIERENSKRKSGW